MSILIDNLYKRYGDNTVLNGLTFNFENGRKYVIKGENGAGKSTLIKAILNQIHYEGFISVKGRISYCPDSQLLLSFMTAETFIKTFSTLSETIPKIDYKIKYYLELFNALKIRKCFLGSLSKGQRQKANIIQSLLTPSEILILDEPTSGLDSESKEVLLKLLKEDTRTIIVISHETELFDKGLYYFLEIRNGNIEVLSQVY